jgi:hypothetical protein
MHVIAHYRITDPDAFRLRSEEPVRDRPPHWRLVLSAPVVGGSSCFDLWWTDSATALERVLRRSLGSAGSVECLRVDEENALGLDLIVRCSGRLLHGDALVSSALFHPPNPRP